MNRQEAEIIITEYLKPIFGFALKRCKNEQDAEDLSQEIVFRAFRALLVKDDIEDAGKFIWAIAHNTLSNYYRDTAAKDHNCVLFRKSQAGGNSQRARYSSRHCQMALV